MKPIALELAKKPHELNKPTVVILPQASDCSLLYSELKFFLKKTDKKIAYFRDYEVNINDQVSPSASLVGDRVRILHQLLNNRIDILILSEETLALGLPPKSFIQSSVFHIKIGDTLDQKQFSDALAKCGYTLATQVKHHFEYTKRGSIIDLYPPHSKHPIRIELDDDQIDSLSYFEPQTQRSLPEPVEEISLAPPYEYFPEQQEAKEVLSKWPNTNKALLKSIKEGIPPSGWQQYLHLFFNKLDSIIDYVSDPCVLFSISKINIEKTAQGILAQYDIPAQRLIDASAINSLNKLSKKIHTHATTSDQIDLSIHTKKFAESLKAQNKNILFVCQSYFRMQQLESQLLSHQIDFQHVDSWYEFASKKPEVGICMGKLSRIFHLPNTIIIPEQNLLQKVITRSTKQSDSQLKESQLSIGDLLIHTDHGIGQFSGIETRTINNIQHDFVVIQYQNNDKLLFPPDQLFKLHTYHGHISEVDHLRSTKWKKRKEKAKESIEAFSRELLQLQSMRKTKHLSSMNIPHDYERFTDLFPFTETPDQLSIMNAIKTDLDKGELFERLVCGDVGFGKTEIAMRSAFIALSNGFQVAILAPTTLLATQHFNNFSDRLKMWPFSMCLMSRNNKLSAIDTQKVADGTHQLIIGTHKILSQEFSNLGLVIIDEEHRFGVRQKDSITAFNRAHKLSLTATPIPRSLNMALSKLRTISVMANPPKNRLPIVTFVEEESDDIILAALEREIHRGGQAYIIYNDVANMPLFLSRMQKLCPNISFGTIHGQMPVRAIETQMARFHSQAFQVLIASTIIESGIDIPHANTMIICRSDKMGLAQLHQIRGRVGRSHHQAYAYLLTPKGLKLQDKALMRLNAIESATSLGSGFQLAIADLEIRGSGNLLGQEQSGHINAIGLSYYTQLINEALLDDPMPIATDVELNIPMIIPQSFIPDAEIRYQIYHEISTSTQHSDLENIENELRDRFGTPPIETQQLIGLQAIKIHASTLKITGIQQQDMNIEFTLMENPNCNPDALIALINEHKEYQFSGPNHIKIIDTQSPIQSTMKLLNKLQQIFQ